MSAVPKNGYAGGTQLPLFGVSLDASHYLGSFGARARCVLDLPDQQIVFASPCSRRLPSCWLELSRWCIDGTPNAGSRGWKIARAIVRQRFPDCTTVVSYSDPSVGHTGALYRACNWLWAPTWHVLREPPTGSGVRGGKLHRAKHRWVDPLLPDPERGALLMLKDPSLARRMPWAQYVEPRWRGEHRRGGGADFKRWQAEQSRDHAR